MKIKVSLAYMTKLLNDLQYYENESHCGWPTYPDNLKNYSEKDVLRMYKEGHFKKVRSETDILGEHYEFQEIVDEIKNLLAEKRTKMQGDTHCYPQTVVCWEDIVAILDQVKGGQ